jgi:hypothetical protein
MPGERNDEHVARADPPSHAVDAHSTAPNSDGRGSVWQQTRSLIGSVLKGTARKVIISVAVPVVAGAIFFSVFRPSPAPAQDVRSQLASTFNVDAKYLYINLPPADGRLPGFAFVNVGPTIPLVYPSATDKAFHRGPDFDMNWAAADTTGANFSVSAGFFSTLLKSAPGVTIAVRATHAHVVELSLDEIKRRVLHSSAMQEQYAKGNNPFVVVRSYEAILKIHIARSSGASVQSWTQKQQAADQGAKTAHSGTPFLLIDKKGENDLEITVSQPVVFAYEVLSVRFVSTSLGTQPDDVKFERVPAAALSTSKRAQRGSGRRIAARRMSHLDGTRRRVPTFTWGLITIVQDGYPKNRLLEPPTQGFYAQVADRVSRDLAGYQPRKHYVLIGTDAAPLTSGKVISFVANTARQAKLDGVDMLVVYYIGHALAGPNGEVFLLQGDVGFDDVKRLQASPRAGNGVLTLSNVYEAFGRGPPFAILLENCMDNDQFLGVARSLGFAVPKKTHGFLLYVGEAPVVDGALTALSEKLRSYVPAVSDLRQANIVIFGAKPGISASILANPDDPATGPLPPLAQRVHRWARITDSSPDSLSMGRFIRNLTDWTGTGEITLYGTASWSDFDAFYTKLSTLAAARTEGTASAMTTLYRPNVGAIKDFFFAHDATWYLVTNDFKLYSWRPPAKSTKLKDDVATVNIAGGRDSTAYLYVGYEHTLYALEPAWPPRPVLEDLFLRTMTGDHSGTVGVLEPVHGADGAVRRLPRGVDIDRFDTGDVDDAAIWQGTIYYLRDGRSALYQRAAGRETIRCRALDAPSVLAASSSALYVLSADRLTIYRISSRHAESADLSRLIPKSAADRPTSGHAFQALEDGTILLREGDHIVAARTGALPWRGVQC